ncbi:hypothetical protein MY11210_002074 [Beauveria gryllotalpidicola]
MPKRTQTNRPQPNAQRRRRVYAACRECRRRRRKCDGSQPCAQCQAYGYACLYDAENSSWPAQSSSSDAAAAAANPSQPQPLQTSQRGGSGDEDATPTPTPTPTAPPPPPSALIVSRERGRFISAHSAVALPHLVGQDLAITQPPLRLHSYAWNLGIRPERGGSTPPPSSLADYLTLAECQTLCAAYFSAVHPLFAFLHPKTFTRRLARGWNSSGGGGGGATVRAAATTALESGQPNFAAVVALVAVLGSVFSPTPHAREQDIKRHGLALLDLGLSSPVAPVDTDAVAGWILRALYMRLTTRPAISAMASHTAMHIAEIIGLHREMQDAGSSSSSSAAAAAATTSKVSSSSFSDEELETRRRCFCVARFLNLLLTTEYGLSAVSPRHTTCLAPARVPGAHIDALHTMGNVLHDANTAAAAATTRAGLDSDDFADLFRRLRDMPRDDDLVALFAADVCLCLLRRFPASSLSSWSNKPGPRIVAVAAAVLRRALDAVAALLAAGRTWWNMLSVPFQSVCVCVLVDDDDGRGLLELLPAAMELLRAMADRFESHMAREALATAQQVVAASRGRTEAKLAIKDAALSHALPAVDIDWASFDAGFDMGHDWPPVVDFFG